MPSQQHKGGRPPHKPTERGRQTVEILAGYGLPHEKICLVVGVSSVNTLKAYYAAELQRGSATVEAKLAGNLLKIASGTDNVALKAIIFSLQTRFGWRIPVEAEAAFDDGNIGKKEAAQRAARTAGGEDTDWGDDLRPTRPN